jgi:hypothetical protein
MRKNDESEIEYSLALLPPRHPLPINRLMIYLSIHSNLIRLHPIILHHRRLLQLRHIIHILIKSGRLLHDIFILVEGEEGCFLESWGVAFGAVLEVQRLGLSNDLLEFGPLFLVERGL